MSTGARTEVVVVGGGPAATATAVTLARAGVDTTLVAGPAPDGSYRPGEGAPPGTDRIVHQIFGSELRAFDPAAHLPAYGNRSAWNSDELVTTDFMFNPFGAGWHLDRGAFDARLLDATAAAGVDVLRDTSVVESTRDGGWHLHVAGDTDRELRATFVCDASGRRAVVARAHGAPVEHTDRLTALACILRTDDDSDTDPHTIVEATPDGWWYTARLPRGLRVATYFTDPDLVDLVRLRHAAAFTDLLSSTTHVAAVVAGHHYSIETAPTIAPAATTRLRSPVGPGWLAVGDAASTFDPLSSQGILTALVMGREAGTAAAHLCTRTAACAAESYASGYERIVETYRRDRDHCYGSERRWSARAFWARRHTAPPS